MTPWALTTPAPMTPSHLLRPSVPSAPPALSLRSSLLKTMTTFSKRASVTGRSVGLQAPFSACSTYSSHRPLLVPWGLCSHMASQEPSWLLPHLPVITSPQPTQPYVDSSCMGLWAQALVHPSDCALQAPAHPAGLDRHTHFPLGHLSRAPVKGGCL